MGPWTMGHPTDRRAPAGTPLYVHLPFCATKCPYCDFFSVPAEGQDLDGLVAAVLAEAEVRAPRRPTTVFFGGGTPSLLPAELLRPLLDGLHRITGFRDTATEVTAECNPESLDAEKARLLVGLGVRRISIGIQSLHDEVLELFGRVHDANSALRAYDAARAAEPASVNVDLIFAHPGQEPQAWRDDLARILALGPDHVAAYNLTFEAGTQFSRWLADGRIEKLPEERELELFLATREVLTQGGLEAYEISNFARSGHRCHHNVNYWHNGPYAGIGPSAVSAYAGERRGNVRPLAEYTRRAGSLRQESPPSIGTADWTESLEPLARLGETWWLGLRLAEGVDPERARAVAGLDASVPDPALDVVRHLIEVGLLESREGDGGERIRLTPAGLPLADAVAREFLDLGREAGVA